MKPTRSQIQVTQFAVEWYLQRYFRTADDPGVTKRFCEPAQVGAFALDPARLAEGDARSLFRLLVMTVMFQRRQDQQILRVLRGTPASRVRELTDPALLLRLASESPCACLRSNANLIQDCDLAKDPVAKHGCCRSHPELECHLKHHTVWLKRYGHFGKVPTSAALMIREHGAEDLPHLYAQVIRAYRRRTDRAEALERALGAAWRISQKIASMFLSAVCNPDISDGLGPWGDGVEWRHFVVVDSNVDLFLRSINYRGGASYNSRREFIRLIAQQIDLRALDRRLHRNNPRLVQQAMYLFMSASNRRSVMRDCMHEGQVACNACPRLLSVRCPVRSAEQPIGTKKKQPPKASVAGPW
jgi:hypothetical protein